MPPAPNLIIGKQNSYIQLIAYIFLPSSCSYMHSYMHGYIGGEGA